MNFSQRQAIIIGVGAVLALVFLVLVVLNIKSGPDKVVEVQLSVWGTENKKVFESIMEGYSTFRTNAEVTYTQINENRYEEELLDALAAGRGPDVFFIDNNALFRQKNKLTPINRTQLDLVRLRDIFPQVVEQDFVSEGEIYALPLYIDTLSLVYNKDLFDQASVVFPPGTWQDFQGTVQVLRKVGINGKILQAGAAIGGSDKSISNAQDILYLLMLQNGVPMVNSSFSSADFSAQKGLGLQAFNFYTQFANIVSPYYTWNDSQPEFLESFGRGETAMIFAYKKQIDSFQDGSPFLNYAVVPAPQPAGTDKSLSYSDYDGLAVSGQSKVKTWAWDFILYATTRPQVATTYLDLTKRPPALRSLISEKINDETFGVFARQALTARSWKQADDLRIEKIISNAISNVLTGKEDTKKALDNAERQVTEIMKER